MKIIKKICKYVASAILIIILLISLYSMISISLFKKDYVNIFGYTYFVISSGSMSPSIDVNDLIIVKINDNYNVGDIITYKDNNYFVTHRIKSINENTLVTKGDANNIEDEIVQKENVIGKVSLVVSASFLLKFLGILILIFIIISVINFDDIFKKYIIKDKPKNESPLDYTQVIPVQKDDKKVVEEILEKTQFYDALKIKNGEKTVELKLNTENNKKIKENPKKTVKDSDKKLIKDILKILEINSKGSKITTDNAIKLKYLYQLSYTILINPKNVLTLIENKPFEELYDYEFDDINFTNKIENRLYEMPIYIYILIMIYSIVYNNDYYFDAVFKVIKFRIKIDRDNEFVRNNYKVDKCIDLIETIVSRCEQKEKFKLDKIKESITLEKDIVDN